MRNRYYAILAIFPLLWLGSPPDPADYRVLDAEAEPFRSAFNAEADKVRLVMYVSPTCGGCLRGADRAQKEVLAEIDSEDLAVFVVWVRKNGAREKHVAPVLRLVTDSRARHYWDGQGAVLGSFDELLALTGSPCAGAFLLYAPAARWTGEVAPRPEYWQDAHPELDRSDAPTFDGNRLAEATRTLLSER